MSVAATDERYASVSPFRHARLSSLFVSIFSCFSPLFSLHSHYWPFHYFRHIIFDTFMPLLRPLLSFLIDAIDIDFDYASWLTFISHITISQPPQLRHDAAYASC
jgi:hypothetical protein